ncbi:MAG: hypothetical protein RR893_11600 [Clostridia bacterium]
MAEYLLLALDGLRQWLRGGTLPGWAGPALCVAGVVIGWVARWDWVRSCDAEDFEEWVAECAEEETK